MEPYLLLEDRRRLIEVGEDNQRRRKGVKDEGRGVERLGIGMESARVLNAGKIRVSGFGQF